MSTVSSRGVYHFPVREERFGHNDQGHSDIQLSSYDLAVPGWATSMESEFHALDTCTYVFGQFVWTGFDYLGEPSPYNEQWPARSSYFGIVDLCGLPKDRYYMFKTQWTDQDVLHILPHWSWPGREGQKTPIHIYTSFESVELFLNGRSLGRKQFQKKSYNLLNHYRLIWEDVLYEPGELKAVAYTGEIAVAEKIVKTAGHPEQINLSVDRDNICGDGEDMAFVTVAVQDAAGTLCPHAAHQINFEIDGPGEIAAVCNGDPTCLDSFKSTSCKVFNGLCVVYLRSLKNKTGKLILKASSPSIHSKEIEINVR
jgi:beta-galactosidase